MKYIATREGVEVLTGKGPATEKQKEMVAKLLKDFPDMRDSFEYEDSQASAAAPHCVGAHFRRAGRAYAKSSIRKRLSQVHCDAPPARKSMAHTVCLDEKKIRT